jgi:hypothetical protein
VRIDDYPTGAAVCEKSAFELQNVAMLAIEVSNKSFQRKFKFPLSSQPSAMDTVTGAVNVTIPDSLESHQNIQAKLWPDLFQTIGKPNWRSGLQAVDCSKGPLILRPFVCRNQLRVISSFDNSAREPL